MPVLRRWSTIQMSPAVTVFDLFDAWGRQHDLKQRVMKTASGRWTKASDTPAKVGRPTLQMRIVDGILARARPHNGLGTEAG